MTSPNQTSNAERPPVLMIVTHPRSTSTALERSFLTREDLVCIHEPFGDPFYFGPERMSDRYSDEECKTSPYAETTYKSVVDDIYNGYKKKKETENPENPVKAIVIKDMAQYIIPPKDHKLDGHTSIVAPSFKQGKSDNPLLKDDLEDPSNVTVLPFGLLKGIQYVFLIRPPHLSVPSYYRCCIPPQSEETGFDHYRSSEAGYRELRILYDYITMIASDPTNNIKPPIIVESNDVLQHPEEAIKTMCEFGGFPFEKSMLSWDETPKKEVEMFSKWKGFHHDALKSTGFSILKNNDNVKPKMEEDFVIDFDTWEQSWKSKFGNDEKIVKDIKESVKEHLDDYLYLRNKRINF